MGRDWHPLLKGKRGESKYSHGFSKAEMKSMKSICEAVLPPLPFNSNLEGKEEQPTKPLQFFYQASGAHSPIPDEVQSLSLFSLSHFLFPEIVQYQSSSSFSNLNGKFSVFLF